VELYFHSPSTLSWRGAQFGGAQGQLYLTFYSYTSPWRWSQQSPPKHWYPTTSVKAVTTQKTSTWIFPAVKASDLAARRDFSFTHYVSAARVQALWRKSGEDDRTIAVGLTLLSVAVRYCRSQWPFVIRRVWCWSARTLPSCFRIPLEAWM
jgi:hypothetical protein